MKKNSAILALAIVLFSCNKKETQTIEKIDPTTGQTITVEVPASDSAQEATPYTPMAIQDSAGVYRQKLLLEAGKSYPFTTYQKDVISGKMPDGSAQSITRESTDEIEFKVNQKQNGVYDMDIIFVSKKTTQSGIGPTQTIDTKAPAPKDEGLKNRWEIEKALISNPLKLKLRENGEIISIVGFDVIYAKLKTTIAKLTKDPEQQNATLKAMKESFNEKMIREQLSKNLFILPKKGAKLGQTWTLTENATPDGKVKLTTNYTLLKVDNGVAEISVKGGIPKQNHKETQNGITQTLSSEIAQSGTYQLDVHTGWIKSQNITVRNNESQTFSDGKQSQTMTSNSVMTIIVNPKS